MTASSPLAAPARAAASVLVLRHRAEPEVLMGWRGAHHRFMPNHLVFPGGAVDPDDFTTAPRRPLREAVAARLARHTPAELVTPLAVAAARELAEESGLSLGTPPDLAPLAYLCRAITPEGRPIRFDARFFVVAAEALSGTLGGSGELESLRFYPLSEALALSLAPPTRFALETLGQWLARPQDRPEEEIPVPVLENLAIRYD
jgi:8-oxo-dGTP pyrophosphatase MutT (NUDIX family)